MANGRPSLDPMHRFLCLFLKATFGFCCPAYDIKFLGLVFAEKHPKKPNQSEHTVLYLPRPPPVPPSSSFPLPPVSPQASMLLKESTLAESLASHSAQLEMWRAEATEVAQAAGERGFGQAVGAIRREG